MKKFRNVMFVLLLVVGAVTLAGCSKYNAIKSAFEDEGYTENEQFTSVVDSIKAELEKEEYAVELHLLTKSNGITSALVIEFKSTKEMVEAYEENETIQGLVKDIQSSEDVNEVYAALEEAGFAKGNCLVVPLSLLYVNEITGIVKSVK